MELDLLPTFLIHEDCVIQVKIPTTTSLFECYNCPRGGDDNAFSLGASKEAMGMLLALFEERAAMLLLSSATRMWGFLSKGHCLLSQLQQHSQQTFVARGGQRGVVWQGMFRDRVRPHLQTDRRH